MVLDRSDVMPGPAATGDVDRRAPMVERLFDRARVLSQRRFAWTGMRAELVTLRREQVVENELLTGSHALFMDIEGLPHDAVVEAEGLPQWQGVKGPGQSAFFPSGRRMRSWHGRGFGTTMVLFFDEAATEELLHRERPLVWQARPSADDAYTAATASELAAALGMDDDLSRLRAETLATGLHLHSLHRFSDIGARRRIGKDPVNRAIEMIQARLPRTVSLTELVTASGLSRARFLAAFRERTRLTPHQYIVHERLARAKSLISTTKLSIREIATAVGCANPEHLGQMFRQHLDVSPRVWRHLNARAPRSGMPG